MLGGLIVPAVCLAMLGYFLYHGITGRFGVQALSEMRETITRLEYELAAIIADRKALEERVMLLREGSLERDMLDEQARAMLNLFRADEVAILRERPAPRSVSGQ